MGRVEVVATLESVDSAVVLVAVMADLDVKIFGEKCEQNNDFNSFGKSF